MRTCKFLLALSMVALVLGVSLSAQATVITTDSANVSGDDNSITTENVIPASALDLVNNGQSTFSSAIRSRGDFFNVDANTTLANDGLLRPASAAGEFYPITSLGVNPSYLPVAYTFVLNTTTNTNGYDITQIDSFAGWNENSRSLANQNMTVEVSKVGSNSWLTLGTYTYAPFTDLSLMGATETRLRLTNQGGGILSNGTINLTGVDAIRITYLDNGSTGASIDGMVVQEIDVVGSATVPEPSTTILSLAGAAAMMAYAWRKRK